MKTATTRELRNDFARLSRLLDQGEQIAITKHGKPYAILSPDKPAPKKKPKAPDYLARMARYGDEELPSGTTDAILDYDRSDR